MLTGLHNYYKPIVWNQNLPVLAFLEGSIKKMICLTDEEKTVIVKSNQIMAFGLINS